MSMLLLNKSEYYSAYDMDAGYRNCKTGLMKNEGNRIIAFTPILWVIFFALATVLANSLTG